MRHFAFAYISAGYFHARGKMGYCSVDINYDSISEIKKVQINSWTIEERSYEGKNGLLFSNQKTSEDTFVMGQYIAIAGVYQTGR